MCCTLRDDLLKEVRKLTEDSRFDYLLIESIGISEPLPMAATFDFRDEHSESLSDVARLDTMVRVVDAANLLNEYASPISCASAESRSATTTTAPFADCSVVWIENPLTERAATMKRIPGPPLVTLRLLCLFGPVIVALQFESNSFVTDPEIPVAPARDRIRPHHLHILRHDADIDLRVAAVAEPIDAEPAAEPADQLDILFQAEV
jgi:hypothetical protein